MTEGIMTVGKLMAAMRRIPSVPVRPRIIFTMNALKETDQRLFPASRHRSKRINKKLIRRFGGKFRKVPYMWRVGDTIYAHPALKAQIDAALPERVPTYGRLEGER